VTERVDTSGRGSWGLDYFQFAVAEHTDGRTRLVPGERAARAADRPVARPSADSLADRHGDVRVGSPGREPPTR